MSNPAFGAVSLVQGIHLSARFTLVSPAALLDDHDDPGGCHLVDGGYFENTGAATAKDIVYTLRQKGGPGPGDVPLVIVVHYEEATVGAMANPLQTAAELTAPVAAVLQARVARGTLAIESLADELRALGRPPISFTLTTRDTPLPLGWLLSRKAMGDIERQLDDATNQAALSDTLAGLCNAPPRSNPPSPAPAASVHCMRSDADDLLPETSAHSTAVGGGWSLSAWWTKHESTLLRIDGDTTD